MGRDELLKSIVSGQKRGLTESLVYPFLHLLSLPYGALIRLRNFFYDSGLLPVRRAPAKVVSVGNLTVGGTGKTPLVAYLVEQAIERGFCPAVIARGYKGALRGGEWLNDEGLLLKEKFPGLVVIQNPDRIAAARRAVDEMGADFIILDDAFQHRRIERDVDVLTVDARAPFGNGRVLPAGILREPISGIARADAIVLTRCGDLSDVEIRAVEERLAHLAEGVPLFLTDHVPERLRFLGDGEEKSLDSLDGKKLFICSGIALPRAFRMTVESMGGTICGERHFADHHHYQVSDLIGILDEARESGAEAIVTTEKDAVKLHDFDQARHILVLGIAIRFREGGDAFNGLLFGSRRQPLSG